MNNPTRVDANTVIWHGRLRCTSRERIENFAKARPEVIESWRRNPEYAMEIERSELGLSDSPDWVNFVCAMSAVRKHLLPAQMLQPENEADFTHALIDLRVSTEPFEGAYEFFPGDYYDATFCEFEKECMKQGIFNWEEMNEEYEQAIDAAEYEEEEADFPPTEPLYARFSLTPCKTPECDRHAVWPREAGLCFQCHERLNEEKEI